MLSGGTKKRAKKANPCRLAKLLLLSKTEQLLFIIVKQT